MIERHLGKIFDPAAHDLIDDGIGFAQSPQALEFNNFVRVYFCTRSAEPGGVFRSHVAYADFDKDFATVIDHSRAAIVPPADLGTFDEHGIFPFNPVKVGEEVWGYTCGWNRRRSVPVDTAVGLVVSDDGGRGFRRLGSGPILGPSLHEPFLVGDAFVLPKDGRFNMWYMFGQRWVRETESAVPDRVYKIGYANSSNGIDWQKDEGRQILPDRIGVNECQALPSVIEHAGCFHMVFCYRDVHGFRSDPTKGYRLGYARSCDLRHWIRDDAALGLNPTPDGWDGQMQCYPHLCHVNGIPHLLYNGNAFGKHGFGAAVLSLDSA